MTDIASLLKARKVNPLPRATAANTHLHPADGSETREEATEQLHEPVTATAASEASVWPLTPPALFVYRCRSCGTAWLQPRTCCGQRPRRTAASYYVAGVSERPAAAPEFSVIMLTKNHLPLTQIAVESLRRARGSHSLEFIFVDCSSTDGSLNYFRDLARHEAVQIIVTHPEELFIYSRNCNRGAQAARGGFLLFANNDIEARDPDLFVKLANGLNDSRVGVLGTLTDQNRANELQHRSHLPEERVWSVKPVMGFLWGVRAEVFAELGGMDEEFRDYGCDDFDFQFRAIRRHYRIAIVDSLVCHEVRATFGANVAPSLLRNVARFDAKHGCQLVNNREWFGPFLSHRYPAVSVAVACRNYGQYLPRALDSALGSSLPAGIGLQVVVANDASTDDTASVLEQYRHRCPAQVTVVHCPVSHGPAAAKNAAIDRCLGETIALLDADDEFLVQKLRRSLEMLEATGAEFLYHDFLLALPDGREEQQQIGRWSLPRWRHGRTLPPSTWVFRSGSVRFCEAYAAGEDPEFLRRRWKQLNTAYLPEALTRHYRHSGSLSSQATCQVVTSQLKGKPLALVVDDTEGEPRPEEERSPPCPVGSR